MSERPPPLRVVIVEDSPPQRRLLADMLAGESGVVVVGQAATGREAVSIITRLRPDLAFLDVRLPELDAFEVLERIGPERMPLIVFVTAYDAYAVRAFEAHAIDYLLKPFDEERLAGSVAHARGLLSSGRGRWGARWEQTLNAGRAAAGFPLRLPVRVGDRFLFLDPAEIDWIEARGKSIVLHAGRQSITSPELLGAIARRLDPARFVRVHRSAVVNVARIQEVQPWFKGAYLLILRDGARVQSGRSYRAQVRRFLGAS